MPFEEKLAPGRGAWAVVLGIGLFAGLLGFVSVTRTGRFSPDAMNYVDIASHIASGQGVVQATLGFNQPHLFSSGSPIPSPVVSQPPLYPLLVAGVSLCGIATPRAALIVSAAAYGAILLLAWRLARRLYGDGAGIWTLALLCGYAPLRSAAGAALSEATGIAWVLTALVGLVAVGDASTARRAAILAAMAGLAAGLAMITRYALAPLLPLGTGWLVWRWLRSRQTAAPSSLSLRGTWAWFLAGAACAVVPVLVRNAIVAGRLLPEALPSDQGLLVNLRDAAITLAGNWLCDGRWLQPQAAFFGGIAAIALAVLVSRTGWRRALEGWLVGDGRELVVGWGVLYCGFAVVQRSLSHFDALGTRLMVPAGVLLAVLWAALLAGALGSACSRRWGYGVLAVVLAAAMGRECVLLANAAPYRPADDVAASPRLAWLARHTTPSDLIVAENAVDVPFYLGRQAAVSFSRYPYTRHLAYADLVGLADRHDASWTRVLLVLRSTPEGPGPLAHAYGPMLADLYAGHLEAYPRLRVAARLEEAQVFELPAEPPESRLQAE